MVTMGQKSLSHSSAQQEAEGQKRLKNVFRRSYDGNFFGHAKKSGTFDFCRIKSQCGACKYINLPYAEGLKEKHEEAVFSLKKELVADFVRIIDPIPSPSQLGYRHHTKLAIRTAPKQPQTTEPGQSTRRFAIGLFKPRTHDVVDISSCPLHSAFLGRMIRDLREILEDSDLEPYSEKCQTGDLRYLSARSNHRTGEIMLCFVARDSSKKAKVRQIVKRLIEKGHNIKSAHLNINPENTNAIMGPETVHLSGAKRLRESICGFVVEVSPQSFFQVNPAMAQIVYNRINDLVGPASPGETCLDLYSGTGLISLCLARSGYQVHAIEEVPKAIEDARVNLVRCGLESQVKLLTARIEDTIELFDKNIHQKLKWIVVNPSRRGIADSARQRISRLMKHHEGCKLLYMSCDISTFVRDSKYFLSEGINLRQLEAFDMFAQTDKLEWLGLFT